MISSLQVCYNCKDKGHLAKDCKKPRKQCTRCKRLGHLESDYRVKITSNETATIANPVLTQSQNQYFVKIQLSGEDFVGFVDSGSSVNTICESLVKKLDFPTIECNILMSGYAGGSFQANFKVETTIKVDAVEGKTELLVVPDRLQSVAIIIGRPFLNGSDAVVIATKDYARVMPRSIIELSEIEDYETNKVTLSAKERTVLPPSELTPVSVINNFSNHNLKSNSPIYIEKSLRAKPQQTTVVPFCLVKDFVPILNLSKQEIVIEKDDVVARGVIGEPKTENQLHSILKIGIRRNFSIDELNTDLPKDRKIVLLNLLNKFRDCFAENLSELGKYNSHKMSINLKNENDIVAFRPYRLSFSDRELVSKLLKELLHYDLIQESDSEYASPIVLVKKSDGSKRMCIDFRALNKITVREKFPLPIID